MSQTPEISEGSVDSIKIGSIGTIGSLMSQELDSVNSIQSSSSFRKKRTTNNSMASGPKTTQLNEVSSTEASSSGDHNPRQLCYTEKPKLNAYKNGQCPILSNETHADGKMRRNVLSKKGRAFLVEIVDVKCNNPMSSRLKKLGISKLSETIS